MLVKTLFVVAALGLSTTTVEAGETMERYQFLSPQFKYGTVFLMFDRQTGRTWHLTMRASDHLSWSPVSYGPNPRDSNRNEMPLTPTLK